MVFGSVGCYLRRPVVPKPLVIAAVRSMQVDQRHSVDARANVLLLALLDPLVGAKLLEYRLGIERTVTRRDQLPKLGANGGEGGVINCS